jgi:acetyl-CoA carboxylase biotin carboxyl carrier protein
MKMEIPVEAPRAGVVRELKVTEGQTVQEGDVLATLE